MVFNRLLGCYCCDNSAQYYCHCSQNAWYYCRNDNSAKIVDSSTQLFSNRRFTRAKSLVPDALSFRYQARPSHVKNNIRRGLPYLQARPSPFNFKTVYTTKVDV